ncbi:MAG: DUF58 domain-containing protein [Chloroflexi bacterium]|nr:DUF58 domain-containing protein [Chloroflexota bacterium]
MITHYSFPGWGPAFGAAIERLSIAARSPARGQHPSSVRSRTRGRALEFADYRAYAPGDDPKLVDWRAYARLGRLYLKQYEEERSRTITLLVDASTSMDWSEGDSHKGLYARRLAAGLAWIGVSHHETVQVFLVRDGEALPLPSVSSRATTVVVFRELGAVRESGRTLLADAVRRVARGPSRKGRGPVFLLTDLLDPTWRSALDSLAPSGEAVVLQLLAPDEWEPPLGQEVELVDSESGELRPTRLGPVELGAYRQRLRAFLAEVNSHCHRLGVVHLAINTGIPLHETVLKQLPTAGVLTGR